MCTILSKVEDRPAEEKVRGCSIQGRQQLWGHIYGETCRTLEVHLKEHKRVVKTQLSSNDIAVHINKTGNDIQ